MRQVTQKIRDAFNEGRTLRVGNTYTDGQAIWLHGNKIAERRNGATWVTASGWFSNTTKERLNGIYGVHIIQHRGAWFLNGAEWDGSWHRVTNETLAIESFEEAVYVNGHEFELASVFDQNFNQVNNIPEEVEIDVTSEWNRAGYIKPIYSVYHTNDKTTISSVVSKLKLAGIKYKQVETDTAGTYKPNYFVVVNPNDIQLALETL